MPTFDPGFDVAAMRANNRVISGVDPDLPAYAAGLRDGMVFVRQQSGQVGDPEQQLVLVVREGEQERTISYFPRGRGTYALQRLEIDQAMEGDQFEQCRAVLGGASARSETHAAALRSPRMGKTRHHHHSAQSRQSRSAQPHRQWLWLNHSKRQTGLRVRSATCVRLGHGDRLRFQRPGARADLQRQHRCRRRRTSASKSPCPALLGKSRRQDRRQTETAGDFAARKEVAGNLNTRISVAA